MRRCAAGTKTCQRCLNRATDGDFCTVYRGRISFSELLAVGLGAIVGNAVLPGPDGTLLGVIAGSVARSLLKEELMAKKREFVSFDLDKDRTLNKYSTKQEVFVKGFGQWTTLQDFNSARQT